MQTFLFLLVPFLACLVLVGIHAYLGIHVLARGVIFVDIALAQIAALGTTVAFLRGHEINSGAAYAYSLSFTFIGAAVFALSRNLRERVPQEAIIGITYAVAAALSVLLVDKAPNGIEKIKQLLVGHVDFVSPAHVAVTAAIYSTLGVFHYVFRKRFLALSFDHDAAESKTREAILWDLLFYMSFGFVITSSVQIAGVLLVFCFLIVPAVFAAMFAKDIGTRLAVSWTLGFVVSALGVTLAYFTKYIVPSTEGLPTGPTVVATFGIALIVAFVVRRIRGDRLSAPAGAGS